tara:strand:+ start:7255 stop:8229 length:975 start_codon:yes stop_codon:yes gene_type:complete
MVILKTREMKVDEGDAKALKTQLVQLKREQFNLRFQAETGQLTSTHQITEVRRDIARLKTALRSNKKPIKNRSISRQERKARSKSTLSQNENRVPSVSQEVAEMPSVRDISAVILGETLEMIDKGPLRPQQLAQNVDLDDTTRIFLSRLEGREPNRATTRTARRATSLLIPYLYAHSREDIAAILRLLSVTSVFETKLNKTARQDDINRIVALLELYDIPCVVSAEISVHDGTAEVALMATKDLTQLLDAEREVRISTNAKPVELSVFASVGTNLPERLELFKLPLKKPIWNKRIQLPEGWSEVFVTVNGETTRLHVQESDRAA